MPDSPVPQSERSRIQHLIDGPAPPQPSAPAKSEPRQSMNLLFISQSGLPKRNFEESEDRQEINRRAQQNAFAKRKQSSQKPGLRKLKAAPSRTPPESVRWKQGTPEAASAEPPWPHGTSLTTTIDSSLDYLAPSVRSYLDSCRLDPFRSGKVVMTPQMENVFMYYFTVIMPAVEPVPAEREDYNQWLVPLTVAEPALLYSLIGCMAYDIEQASAIGLGPISRRNMLTERVQYRIRAIQALNECLADPKAAVKPSTLIAVHFLLWQEIFAGDECVHLDGVRRLLELRGGFDGVQRKAIEAIMIGCFWRAIRTRTKPILPMVPDDVPLSENEFSNVISTCDPSVARLGEGLLGPEITPHFDAPMLSILQDARKVWICFERIGIHDFPGEVKRHVSIKRANIEHRLLSYPFDHYGSYRPVQEVCRQALIIYGTAHYNVVQPSSKIARCLVEDLKNALELTDLQSSWGTAHPALVWVLFLGAHMSFGQRERPWFVTALTKASQKLPSHEWIQIRGLLVRFYYSDRVFQESFRKIWEEVELLKSVLPKWF